MTGRAPDLIFTRCDDTDPVLPRSEDSRTALTQNDSGARLATATLVAQARDALVGLGFRSHEARTAVEEACAHVGTSVPLEVLLREALQRCSKPHYR